MINRSVDIVCDECAAAETFPLEGSATEARKQCRVSGWTYQGGVDLCPTCSADPGIRAKHRKPKTTRRKVGKRGVR